MASPGDVCKKDVLKNFAKFTNKLPRRWPATLLKKRLWDKFLAVNFAKSLEPSFSTEFLWWLFLYQSSSGVKGGVFLFL